MIIFLIDHDLSFCMQQVFFLLKLQKQLWSSSDLCTGKTLLQSSLDIKKALCSYHKVSSKQITLYLLIWVSMEYFSQLILPYLLTKSHSPAFIRLEHLKNKRWSNSHCNIFRFPMRILNLKHPFNHLHSQQSIKSLHYFHECRAYSHGHSDSAMKS